MRGVTFHYVFTFQMPRGSSGMGYGHVSLCLRQQDVHHRQGRQPMAEGHRRV